MKVDEYRDITPWPYHWSLAPWPLAIRDWLDILDDVYELIDPWTYENHWHWTQGHSRDPYWPWCVDIYHAGTYPRSQMPPELGDEIADFIAANMGQHIAVMIWSGRRWRPGEGWQHWHGEQGDFVDHIHIEFDPDGLEGG